MVWAFPVEFRLCGHAAIPSGACGPPLAALGILIRCLWFPHSQDGTKSPMRREVTRLGRGPIGMHATVFF